jgi:cytochrome c peroxidase
MLALGLALPGCSPAPEKTKTPAAKQKKSPAAPSAKTEKTVKTEEAVKTEEKTAKTEEMAVKTEEKTAKTEEMAVKTEEKTAKTEEMAVKTEEKTAKTEEMAVKTEEKEAKTEAKPAKTEEPKPEEKTAKTDDKTVKTEEKAVKTEEKTAKTEEMAVKTEEKEAKTAAKTEEPKPEEKTAKTEEKEAKPAEKSAEKTAAASVQVPLGLPALPVPEDNPMTAEKVELGKLLYFDKRVSKDGTVSCATCHDPKMAWAENTPTSEGIGHQKGGRNAPTVINAAYATSQFWDGRAKTLEEQATGPVENPIEMGHKMESVVEAFSKIPEYKDRFQKVFGTEVTKEGFAKAIAAFERTVLSGDSPYDRFAKGDEKALNEAQKRGWELFRPNCSSCHTQPLFSSYKFFNAGVGMDKPNPDEGRKKVTGQGGDLGKFRVPSLRNVADTAPYFHDGSAAKLEDAVALMAGGGKDNANLSEMLKAVRETKFSDKDRQDLVEFLKALSGKYPVVEPPAPPK